MIRNFALTATNTTHTPKRQEKEKIVTWISGDGDTYSQIDYLLIGSNIKTWINYSQTKGTDNPNSENQHKIIRMELRVKFRNGTEN